MRRINLGGRGSWRSFPLLMAGLALFGLGVAFLLRAGLGLDPWSTFHEGLSRLLGVSIGTATVLAGAAVLIVGVGFLGQRLDWGTALNMLLIGPWTDVFLPLVPDAGPYGYLFRWVWLLLGIGFIALGSGMYIGARWGAGPRDGLVLIVAARARRSVRLVRSALELTVLGLGALLGAPVGLGTLAFALLIGPAMQAALRFWSALPPQTTGAD